MSFDVDAADYIARVETAEGPLRSGVQNAVNAFVLGCKADGNWPSLKASVLMAGPQTLAGCLTPLTGPNPTNFGFVESDYDPVTGLKGDGIAKRLGSGRNNNADPQNDKHLSVWIGELAGNTMFIGCGGAGTNSGSTQLFYQSTTGLYLPRVNTGPDVTPIAGTTPATGMLGASRSSESELDWASGGLSGSVSGNSAAPMNGQIVVFGRGAPAAPNLLTAARLGWYSIGEAINLALLDSRLATYMAAVASNAAMVKRKHAAAHFFTSRF